MKKFVAFLVSMLFVTTSVFANVSIPEELLSYPESFTSTHQISVAFEDNSDVRKLIEEFGAMDNGINNVLGVDLLNTLSALFEYNSNVTVKANISPDYRKIKLSVTSSDVFSSIVSSNLNYTVKSKGGIWADIDISNTEAPKLDVIFLAPTSDKYRYANIGDFIPQDKLVLFNTYLSAEIIEKVRDKYAQILSENCKVEKNGSKYKISMNNEDYAALGRAMIEANPFAEIMGNQDALTGEFEVEYPDFKFLGKDGIVATYTLKDGAISRAETKMDISMNLSEIMVQAGMEWPFEAKGIINIKMSQKSEYSKIGTTEVKLPTLDDKNSICLNSAIEEMIPDYEEPEYVFEYPYVYVGVDCNKLPNVNGEYYVPLRSVLEGGYEDTVSISFADGVITCESEYFDGFDALTINIGENKVYADGVEKACGGVILEDGVTYVNTRLFTGVFGWELSAIYHEIVDNTYSVSFTTDVEYYEF